MIAEAMVDFNATGGEPIHDNKIETFSFIGLVDRFYIEAIGKGVIMMDKELFGQLVQSLKEARAIADGKAKPSRSYELKLPNVKQIREQTGLSQGEFAKLIRVRLARPPHC